MLHNGMEYNFSIRKSFPVVFCNRMKEMELSLHYKLRQGLIDKWEKFPA